MLLTNDQFYPNLNKSQEKFSSFDYFIFTNETQNFTNISMQMTLARGQN